MSTNAAPASTPNDDWWKRLLHRWFIEYNPLYLLSATLVLGGMFLLSRGFAESGRLDGQLGVAAIAEVYALALIGGAAILTRIGWRRSAVMLAGLAVVYQCDLTLHTETCAHLGAIGAWAAGAWLVLFLVKLRALEWAMRIRIARMAFVTTTLGAAGLAGFPLFSGAAAPLVTSWLAIVVFSYRADAVVSLVDLDAWGTTVLRRATRASWLVLALLLLLHLVFRSGSSGSALPLVLVLPILSTRWIRSELRVWAVVVATLAFSARHHPASFAALAFAGAIALAWRAWTIARAQDVEVSVLTSPSPYRASGAERPASSAMEARVIPGDYEAMIRLATGSLSSLYLALWTLRWSGGPWPAHLVALDLALGAIVLFAVVKCRARMALAPLASTTVHFVIAARLVSLPDTMLGWGALATTLGFVLLAGSLGVSYRLRARPATHEAAPP